MKGVSNVVAAIVLIGITLAGFAIVYPTLFSRVHGVYSGSILEVEAWAKGVKLSLLDYDIDINYYDEAYEVKLLLYNAGWHTAHIVKVCIPVGSCWIQYVDIEPGETEEINISVQMSYGSPSRIVVVTKTRVFIFDLK